MVCHSLLQWTTFCQASPPWPIRFGWLHTAWLHFIEIDKAVIHVIRLASCLWLCFSLLALWCPLSVTTVLLGFSYLACGVALLAGCSCLSCTCTIAAAALFWGGSKITANGDCSHEIKRHLLLGRKVMTNLHTILKSRDITLPTNVPLVKAMVFPVVMYGCESWTIKKAARWRIDAFELWCWRRLLRVPWTQGDPTSMS